MWAVREVLEIVLLLAKVIGQALWGSQDFRSLEAQVFAASQEAARRLLQLACRRLDEQLAERRDKRRLRLIHTKPRVLLTWFGEVQLERRYYRDGEAGEGRFLLDEALGLAPRQRLSPLVQEQAVALAMDLPYHRATAQLEALTLGVVRVSAMELWEAVQASGERARQRSEARRRAVFDDGEVPPGQGRPEVLHVEVDEVWVPARGERSRLPLKLAVGYEGKRAVGTDRRCLAGRRVHAGVTETAAFFEQVVAEFGQHWAWDAVTSCWFGADGAAWAKQGLEYVPRAVFRLDRYHLRKALRQGLGHDMTAYSEVATAIAEGWAWSQVAPAFAAAAKRCRGRRRQRLRELERYLASNWEGIREDETARSLGAIEGQVYHHVARRMKRHGARWSLHGADHLARLLAARANGELEAFTRCRWARRQALMTGVEQLPLIRPVTDAERDDLEQWLRVRMPALYGPDADRPWVKYVLRPLAHAGVA